MRGIKNVCKITGYAALAFGTGILLTYFLPCSVLVVLESAIIITAGGAYILNR